jgi:hypothetical protein
MIQIPFKTSPGHRMKFLKWAALLFLYFPSLSFADFGCHFVINSLLATSLDGPEKKISFRFTCRQDMSLIGASFYCAQAQKPPEYKISLEEDEKGEPSSKPLESFSVTPKGGCWVTVPLNNLSLLHGKVYHLVIEQDVNRGGQHPVGIIDAGHFASIAYGDHLNAFDPRDEIPDPKLNVLVFGNGKWQVLNRQPLYALHGSGSKFQGVPYDSFGELPIHGNGTPKDRSDDVLQGEALHPHTGLLPTGFAIRVRKQGHPTAPLNYRVYSNNFMQHTTALAFAGQALLPEQVKETFQWVTIGIKKTDNPKPFPPECRYVVFQTDSGRGVSQAPGCEDCYFLSEAGNSGGLADASDLTFDGGAHVSREAFSTDGWTTWQDEFERDANLVILGSMGATPQSPAQAPIPTPEPWFQDQAP